MDIDGLATDNNERTTAVVSDSVSVYGDMFSEALFTMAVLS